MEKSRGTSRETVYSPHFRKVIFEAKVGVEFLCDLDGKNGEGMVIEIDERRNGEGEIKKRTNQLLW